jgi:cobalt-zinc-cadmium efflux system protein
VVRLKKGTTLNERAVMLHLLEDVLGWVAVLVASVVMMLTDHPFTRWLDPALSLGITAWVLWNVAKNLRDTFRILLQGVPEGMDVEELRGEILAVDGVEAQHGLYVWSQDGESHVMTLHVVVAANHTPEEAQRIKEAVREVGRRHGIDHVTVEVESVQEGDCGYRE